MDFIKHINDSFESIEFLADNVLSVEAIKEHIASLEKSLVDSIQNFASSPIVIERMEKTIKEMEEVDTTGMSDQDKAEVIGGIKYHKIQQTQNIAANERAKEDIAYFQTLLINWRKILDKFTK